VTALSLKIRQANQLGSDFFHPGPIIRIGRNPEAELAFDDEGNEAVSWDHAQIELSGSTAILRDLGSSNGTFVNGQKLIKPVALNVLDTIVLGATGPQLIVAEVSAATAIRIPEKQQRRSLSVTMALVLFVLVGGVAAYTFKTMSSSDTVAANSIAEEKSVVPAAVEPPTESTPPASVPAPKSPDPSNTPVVDPPLPPTPVYDNPPRVALSLDQLESKYRDAIVWVGIERKEYIVPWCTGWAVNPTTVVCTATNAEFLRRAGESKVFVYCGAIASEEKRIIKVTKLTSHSKFDADQDTSATSWLNNVAVLSLETPLPSSCGELASSDELTDVVGTHVFVLAYGIPLDEKGKKQPFDLVTRPRPMQYQGSVSGTRTFPGAAMQFPLWKLTLAAVGNVKVDIDQNGLAGASVFNNSGKVIGVLVMVDSEPHSVSIDRLRDTTQPLLK
jgi:hypothetical protein